MLFIPILILEAALAVCRAKTRSMLWGAAAMLRGASILMLIALAALSVIEWGFRYYALAVILAISAAASIVQLLRKKASRTEHRRARLLWKAAGMAALLLTASLPAMVFPEYKPLPTTGEYRVKTEARYFTDESRTETYGKHGGARTLAAEFWYPEHTAGRFPLVVFSHGSFGTRTSNETLFRELASHGYVVCSVDHAYHCLYTADENGKPLPIDGGYMNELRGENAKQDKQNSLMLYKKWMGIRVADINFVIDAIASRTKSTPSDEVYGLVNIEKIGVIGHSLGGSAALGIGRLRSDIRAVIALESPFLCDILDVENGSFVFEDAEYPVPILSVYSDSSWTHLAQWPQYARNVRLLSGWDKNAYSVHMEGAGHLSLTDLSLASPVLTRILNGHGSSVDAEDYLIRLNETCLSFFDRFLKDTAANLGSLSPGFTAWASGTG